MSAITELSPACQDCGGTVHLEVDFGTVGAGLYAECRDCGRAAWVVRRP